MAKFINTKYITQYTGQRRVILINVDEIVCVKRSDNPETCVVMLAHADDDTRQCSFEIDMPFGEIVDILYSNDNILTRAVQSVL